MKQQFSHSGHKASSTDSVSSTSGQPREDVDLKTLKEELRKRKKSLEGLKSQSQNRRSPLGEEVDRALSSAAQENRYRYLMDIRDSTISQFF